MIRASHKTEHYEPCSLVQPGAPMTRPGFSPKGLIEKNSLRGLSSKLASGRFLLKVSYPKKSMVLPSRSARRSLQRLDFANGGVSKYIDSGAQTVAQPGHVAECFASHGHALIIIWVMEKPRHNMSRATYVAEQFFHSNMSLKSN